jgi:hypothetical protein
VGLSQVVCSHLRQVHLVGELFEPCLEYQGLFGEGFEEYHNLWQRWVSREVNMMSATFPLVAIVWSAFGTFDVAKARAILTAMSVFLKEPVLKKQTILA